MQRDVALHIAGELLFACEPAANLSEADVADLVEILRRNRVPVADVPEVPVLEWFKRFPSFGQFLRDERERCARDGRAYSTVATAWDAEGIEAVLIKSPGYFPYTSSNTDVLVSTMRVSDACRVLENLGYRELRIAREPYKRLFRRVEQPHLGFAIHLHIAVAWINRFLPGADVLAGCRRSEQVESLVYPSPDDVFLITTAHWIYEDKQLTLRDLYHISLALADGVDRNAVRRRAEQAGWRDGLDLGLAVYRRAAENIGARSLAGQIPDTAIRARLLRYGVERKARTSSFPIRLPKVLCKGLQFAKTFKDPDLSTGATARELCRIVFFTTRAKLPSIRRGPLLTVSISGPDGVGKTTLARGLQDFLKREVGVSASYHWMRLGSSNSADLMRRLGVAVLRISHLTRRIHGQTIVASSTTRKTFLNEAPVLRAMWTYLLVVDFLFRLWRRRLRCRVEGGIHIFDRDAVDAAVDLEAMYACSQGKWISALGPTSDVQILIAPDVSRPVAMRFDGHTAELYARHASSAHALLPGGEPVDSLVDQAARVVLASYMTSG
jgi:hypothetical protein